MKGIVFFVFYIKYTCKQLLTFAIVLSQHCFAGGKVKLYVECNLD